MCDFILIEYFPVLAWKRKKFTVNNLLYKEKKTLIYSYTSEFKKRFQWLVRISSAAGKTMYKSQFD